MENKELSVYILAISPDDRVTGLVRNMKKRLQKHLGRDFGSVNSLGHISLILFVAHEEDYPPILKEFQRVLAGLAQFDVNLSGFDDFSDRPECTFFIEPHPNSVYDIVEYCKTIGANFNKFLKRKYIDHWDVVGRKRPHMTIARDLVETEIQKAYALFDEDFTEEFRCTSFTIRKFDNVKKQYQIIDSIPLLGHKYMVGQQMRLF
ncbi:2'-5' RNA ligase family protein [Dyadobacter sp. CY326]|uniref:2'-5' RNA ligase family protein n=1 Tax=Dyadobacter sp. CY326 TaxID=2907300 RepID=UPI001F42B2F5|nr:2'-5' RNA ligase family protein [Dyadobacter sp. CY326]MCE7066115.1 2'-5' RNA ligase family protein [Dyadobacter sp. CY326]